MEHSKRISNSRSKLASLLAVALAVGGLSSVLDARPTSAASPNISWSTEANYADTPSGASTAFNSFTQPSVNESGAVVFRGRTKSSQPVRGIYMRATPGAGTLKTLAEVGQLVPAPNTLSGTFTEFPSFPRIDATSDNVAVRGQSTPVLEYVLPDLTTSRTGTTGIFLSSGTSLSTGASLLGGVTGQEVYSVPDAPALTRFDQFPGSAAIDGNIIAFKGNYTDNGSSLTGVYYRDLSSPTNLTKLIANSSTVIPGQVAGAVPFGATAPPSAAGGKVVFTGWDNEAAPTVGGIYLANLSSTPDLTALVKIGEQVPGTTDTFTNFGEGLSFDGRYVGFWGSWGSATQTVTLLCPTDGQADLIAYCLNAYPNGFTTSVPAHQGIFVYDTISHVVSMVTQSGPRFTGFQYWVFSGSPPGSGSGDAAIEPPRWRASSFVAVTSTTTPAPLAESNYQVAFKATPVAGGSGIYVGQGPSTKERIITAVQTSEEGVTLDSSAPAGTLVSSLGLERDGFRGRYLVINASMLNPSTSEGWGGVYRTTVPENLAMESQTIDFLTPPSAHIGNTFVLNGTVNSGLPITYSLDSTSGADVCSLSGSTVSYLKLGTCVINANQAGDDAYNAAVQVQRSFEVTKRPQAITLDALPPAYVGGSHTLVATADSGLPITYSLDSTSGTDVCSLSGSTVSYLKLGTCVINANQAGDATYDAAAQLQRSISVTLRPQVINAPVPPTVYVGGAYTLTATADSGLAVTLSMDSASTVGSCSLVGAVVYFWTAGICLIDVNQAGDALHAPAPMVQVRFDIVPQPVASTPGTPATQPQPQVITVPTPPPVSIGGTYTLSATTDSGLPVTYAVDPTSTPGACTLVGTTVSFADLGTCVISVSQPGSDVFLPAQSVTQTIVVGAMLTTVNIKTTVLSAKFGQATRAVATIEPVAGGATGTVQFTVDGRNFGAPQKVANGVATSALLVDANRHPLKPGSHAVSATFVPDNSTKYVGSQGTFTHVVKKASTRLNLTVHPGSITARAITVTPGVAVATGTVTFRLGGKVIGRVALHNRFAMLRYTVRAGQAKLVTARYAGSATLLGSSWARAVLSARVIGGTTPSS
ncbi:MAG: hypothetical protein ACYC1I_07305 [Acidimicrobiales bacterium]